MRHLLLAAVAGVLAIALAGAAHGQTPGVPAPPSDVTAGANGFPNLLYIFWRDNSDNENAFRIERSTDGESGPWTLLIEAPNECILQAPTQCAYVDRNLAPDTTYWYRVAAVNVVGMSLYSNVASGRTAPLPTPEPGTIRGYVFHDKNGSGLRESGEEGLSRRWVRVLDGGAVLDENATSDDGEFALTAPPGSHRLVVDLTQHLDNGCGTYAFSYNPSEQFYPCQILSIPWDGTTPTEVDVSADAGARIDFGARPTDVAVAIGIAFLEADYAPIGAHVIASFNGIECGTADVGANHDFALQVLGAGARAGCPRQSDAVQLTVDGVPVTTLLTYHAFSGSLLNLGFMDLPAMVHHAWYWFQISGSDVPADGTLVQAVMSGTVCGEARVQTAPNEGTAGFSKLIVPDAGLRAGCGAPGAKVAFLFNGVPTGEPIEWRPGLQFINPLARPIPSGTGLPSAGHQPNGENTSWPVEFALMAGALLVGAGLLVRRTA